MKLNSRSLVAMVLLFTALAVAMLWVLSSRWQDELRTQVLFRAEQRAAQLADAMGGQSLANIRFLDQALLGMRTKWALAPGSAARWSAEAVQALPAGMVSHFAVADAEGRVVFNSLGVGGDGLSIADRPHFLALKSGLDRLVIGAPVVSRLNGEWLIPVARPLYRDGFFDGEIHLAVSSDYLAHRLGRLALSEQDVVALLHPSGAFLARSLDNAGAMGMAVSGDRPLLNPASGDAGTYREKGTVDGVARLFGWRRLPESGVMVAVGLAESSVLAPLASALARSRWLTGALSLILLCGGGMVSALLWRVDRSNLAMSESERRLKDAQRMAKVGHWTLDHRSGEIEWSDEVYRIFGKQRGSYQPSYNAFVELVHPDDRERMEANFRRFLKTGDGVDEIHRIVMPDGKEKYLRELCVLGRKEGRLERTHGTVQDITEVRAAQLAVEKMNNELEARVASRTRELSTLNNELEAFAYSVSHDLRTPLRSIHGFATLLEEEESERLSPEGRTHLRRIQDGARRMGLLITDLLTMAHHSRAVVNVQRMNLSELAQAVASDFDRGEPARAVQWTIEPDLWAMADPVLMRVVLQNLLGNAWKYTGQTPQARISLARAGEASGMVEFCVRDNGAGFDMAFVNQLFQPFKRLHAHHEFEGSGVGLASVQRLIQRHGGTVRAEGAVGQGAAVYFALPKAAPGTSGSA